MTPWVQVAGWTLVHFVWQGVLIGASSALVLQLLRFRSARVRYAAACAGLVVMVAAPVVTLAVMTSGVPAPIVFSRPAAPHGGSDGSRSAPLARGGSTAAVRASVPIRLDLDRALTVVVVGWLTGVSCLVIRLAGGWWRVRRLHCSARSSVASSWQPACVRLADRIGLGRAIHVVESTLVDVPSVVGWLRPVIVLPVASLCGLAPAQVEAILAHELAHIRRHDYLINLLQTAAETLLFYHPAVWWISRRVRAEREYCCDDVALAVSGDAVVYATALAEIERGRGAGASIAMAADGGSLLDRIRRILRVPGHDAPKPPGWILTLAITAMFTAGAGVVQWIPPRLVDSTASAAAGQPVPSVRAMPAAPDAVHLQLRGVEFRLRWSDGLRFQDVRSAGDLLFSDDLTDVTAIANGGYLFVREWTGLLPRSVEIRAAGGSLTHRFYVGGFERTWSAESQRWLADRLPRLVRRSGLGAPARVRTLLASGGIDKVLEEIGLLEDDYVRQLYASELLKAAGPLDAAVTARLIGEVARMVTSDYYLTEFLKDVASVAAVDASASTAYVAAADRLHSDYEHGRALVALLKSHRQSDATSELAIESAQRMRSDYVRAETLRVAVQEGRLGQGDSLFSATAHMNSDYEKFRVLSTVLDERSPDLLVHKGMLNAAATIDSDYDCAEFLVHFGKRFGVDPATVEAFFAAVGTIDSSFERRRVLSVLLTRDGVGRDIVRNVVNAASTMGADYERAELLLTLLEHQSFDSGTRDLMIDAVDKMSSSYEQGRVLVALVKAGRR